MTRLLIRSLVVAAIVSLAWRAVPSAQEPDQAPAERTPQRVAAPAELVRERVRRVEERIERRLERRFADHDGAHILFGRSYDLPEGGTASEHILVIGGNATIDGHAAADVTVLAGSLRVGPKAVVDGDVSVVGGELDRDPAAQIAGHVHVAHVSPPPWSWSWGGWRVAGDWDRSWWQGAAVAFTIGRIVLVLFLSVLIVLAAPNWIANIAARLSGGPGGAAIVGLAAEIFFAPLMVMLAVALVITIVGIPLLLGLPLLAGGFALAWVAGYAAVTGVLGARLRGSDWHLHGIRPADVFLGSCLLSGLTLFGQVLMIGPGWMAPFAALVRGTGWTVEYIGWTVGLGAALAAWRRSGGFDRGRMPPVVPPLPTPSPAPNAM